MSQSPQVPPEEFAESMRAEVEQCLEQVMEAVNRAPTGLGLPVARRKSATLLRQCGSGFSRRQCRSGWMRRKPLFPPPHHPTTGKRLADKGRQSRTVLTINGRIKTYRRWWHGSQLGSVVPVDAIVDPKGDRITPGVVEMTCRVNLPSTSFERAAAALHRLRRSSSAANACGNSWKPRDAKS